MKICFIVGEFPSLSETYILNQMTGLLDQGHTLCIFAGERSADVVVHEDVIRSGLLQHVRFYKDKPKTCWARIFHFFYLLPLFFLRSPAVVLRALNVFRRGREAWSLDLFFQARFFLEVRDYDIVFCYSGSNGLIGARMKGIGAVEGKLVTVFQASDIVEDAGTSGQGMYKDLFERGDLFLPVSRYAKARLLELGYPKKAIRVHRMGVDLSRFRMTTRKRFGSAPLRLLSVACLVEKKGVSYALDTVARLLREGIPCQYTVIGGGPLLEALIAQARHANILEHVHFIGWQDSGSVQRYLKDADIFLAPGLVTGHGEEEGVPVVLMEAMASQVPVVTTRTGGIRELVEDHKTGFLVPESDSAALADCIRKIWQDPVLAERVAAGARECIEQQYDIKRLNLDLVKLFTAVAYEKHEE